MSYVAAKSAIRQASKIERRKQLLWNVGVFAFLAWAVWQASDLRWSAVVRTWPYLLEALGRSWLLCSLAVAVGMLLAMPLAAGRLYGPAAVRQCCTGFIELVRSMPELMLIFWMYFAAPTLTGYSIPAWWAAIASLILIASSHLAEVIRSGIYTVPLTQWEASFASGLSPLQTFQYVVLPQALRNMLPAFLATVVVLFKTTSLVSVIGVVDFFRAIVLMNNAQFAPYPFFLTCAIVYFVCCGLLSWVLRRIDPEYVLTD